MNWKILLALVIVVGITGFMLFSKKGLEFNEKYLGDYIKTIGSYVSRMTGKFTPSLSVNRTLKFRLTSSQGINDIHLNLQGKPFYGKLIYDSVLVGGQNIRVKDGNEIEIKMDNMNGEVIIDTNGKITVSGYSNSVEVNDIIFVPETGEERVKFYLIGSPISYTLTDVENDQFVLTGTSGSLKLDDWSPLKLDSDNLNIAHFKGTIIQENDSVIISGMAEKVSLNGVDLSSK